MSNKGFIVHIGQARYFSILIVPLLWIIASLSKQYYEARIVLYAYIFFYTAQYIIY